MLIILEVEVDDLVSKWWLALVDSEFGFSWRMEICLVGSYTDGIKVIVRICDFGFVKDARFSFSILGNFPLMVVGALGSLPVGRLCLYATYLLRLPWIGVVGSDLWW